MSVVLKFPSALQPIAIEAKTLRWIEIRILDDQEPEWTRWATQRPISRAASFRALAGFDDAAARAGKRHRFKIRGRRLLARFLREVRRLIVSGRIGVKIDGRAVLPRLAAVS